MGKKSPKMAGGKKGKKQTNPMLDMDMPLGGDSDGDNSDDELIAKEEAAEVARVAKLDDAHAERQRKQIKRYSGGGDSSVANPMFAAAVTSDRAIHKLRPKDPKQAKMHKANKLDNIQWLKLFAGVFLPAADSWSDWAVTMSWYQEGHTWWWKMGAGIMLFAGMVSGTGFWRMTMSEHLKHWTPPPLSQEMDDFWKGLKVHAAKFGCFMLGWIGLIPGAQAYLTLKWDAAGDSAKRDHAKQKIAFLKGIELVVETLGQTCLQVYIGIAFGRLDPASDNFSKTQAFSCILGVVSAGLACFAFEAYHRDELQMFTLYGVSTVLWRASQTAASVCALGLMGCAFKGAVLVPAVLTVILAAYTGAATISVPAYHMAPLNRLVTAKQNVFLGLLSIVLVCVQGYAFFTYEHAPNNYANVELPETTNSSMPQHFDCKSRSDAVIFCIYCLVTSLMMMSTSSTLYEGESLSNLYIFDGAKASSFFLATRLETAIFREMKAHPQLVEAKLLKIASYKNFEECKHDKEVWIRNLRIDLGERLEERRCKWEDAEPLFNKMEDISELLFVRDSRRMYTWSQVKGLVSTQAISTTALSPGMDL